MDLICKVESGTPGSSSKEEQKNNHKVCGILSLSIVYRHVETGIKKLLDANSILRIWYFGLTIENMFFFSNFLRKNNECSSSVKKSITHRVNSHGKRYYSTLIFLYVKTCSISHVFMDVKLDLADGETKKME